MAGSLDTPGSANGITISSGHLCLADDWAGVAIFLDSPCNLFADGFESGDTTMWSFVVGGI